MDRRGRGLRSHRSEKSNGAPKRRFMRLHQLNYRTSLAGRHGPLLRRSYRRPSRRHRQAERCRSLRFVSTQPRRLLLRRGRAVALRNATCSVHLRHGLAKSIGSGAIGDVQYRQCGHRPRDTGSISRGLSRLDAGGSRESSRAACVRGWNILSRRAACRWLIC